ncbi:MAG TPA: ComEC/Rec2 family competence protein [Patescibacteria group bacterium]|nr:ComEC/Rec2 family competence protein [Patescibacteria group bacterium]
MIRFFLILLLLLSLRLYFYHPSAQSAGIVTSEKPAPSIFTEMKSHIRQVYGEYLGGQDADLLMGIVFGDKTLDKTAMKNFQKTGVLHIIAASGMNISMATSFVLGFLILFLRRQHALVATILVIFFYAALADFQASIMRAAIMGTVALGAGIVGRQNTSLIALLFTAFVMIFYDPSVITSISFILSFTATAGIILFDPIMKRVMKSDFFEDFRTTISAQIATTPILLLFFGSYSVISIVTNFLVLWTVPPLMVLGGIAAILSPIPVLAAPLVYLCLPLLSYFFLVIDYFAKHSQMVELKTVPWTLVAGYYLIVAAIWLKFSKNPTTISK